MTQRDARKAAPVKAAPPPPPEAPEPPPPAKTAPPAEAAEAVVRAGGWVDRGDGRGWELEE